MRNILLFVLFLLAVFYVRRALQSGPRRESGDSAPERSQNQAPANEIEQMVACAHCGLHVPESEGVKSGGHFFCSEEHRRLGARP